MYSYSIKEVQTNKPNIIGYDTNIDCVELSKLFLKKEPEIIEEYPPTDFWGGITDGDTGLGTNSTTARFYHYNVLNWEGTDLLKRYIKLGHEQYTGSKDPIFVKCWINIMRKGEQIKKHFHSKVPIRENHYLCGHLSVQVDGTTSTFYQHNDRIKEIENITGMIILFPCYVPHWTNLYNENSERITCAFDIKSQEYFHDDIHPEARPKWVEIK